MTRRETLLDTSDPASEAAADARAEADAQAGRVVGHAAVVKWIRSVVAGEAAPRPRPGD